MAEHQEKASTQKNNLNVQQSSNDHADSAGSVQFKDNRHDDVSQLQAMANESSQVNKTAQLQAIANQFTSQQIQPIQKKKNNTGLPDSLKSGIENLSGHSMDDVKVHFNSDKPAQLNAHAYAQGSEIHLGSGQEKHLPHEAWHVVQQKQGRVKPTKQFKTGVNINDDTGLEKEADVMGAKASSLVAYEQQVRQEKSIANGNVELPKTVQRFKNQVIQLREPEEITADVDDIIYRLSDIGLGGKVYEEALNQLNALHDEAVANGNMEVAMRITSTITSVAPVADEGGAENVQDVLGNIAGRLAESLAISHGISIDHIMELFPTAADFNNAVVVAGQLSFRCSVILEDTLGILKKLNLVESEEAFQCLENEHLCLAMIATHGLDAITPLQVALDTCWNTLSRNGQELIKQTQKKSSKRNKRLIATTKSTLSKLAGVLEGLQVVALEDAAPMEAAPKKLSIADLKKINKINKFTKWLYMVADLVEAGECTIGTNSEEDLNHDGETIEIRMYLKNKSGHAIKNSSFVVHYHPYAKAASTKVKGNKKASGINQSQMHLKPTKNNLPRIRKEETPTLFLDKIPSFKTIKSKYRK